MDTQGIALALGDITLAGNSGSYTAAEQAERIARLLALLKNEAQRLAEESRGCVFGSLPIRPARLGRTLSCVPNVEGIVLGSSHDGDGSGCGRGQWIQPSGPRKNHEGVEEGSQQIIAIKDETSSMVLEVTLLVSGFIIGPGGISIRSIQTHTDTKIRSWSQTLPDYNQKKIRVFMIEGRESARLLALEVIKAAIGRYKFLAEGPCSGASAQQRQTICGIDFYYSPPPKSAAPHAAGLKAFPSQDTPVSFTA